MLNAYSCREILGKYYLVQDLASPCYDAEWGQYAILATVGVMLYPLGILFYSFLILRRNRHKLYMSLKLKRRYGMLYARYEQQYYYWVTYCYMPLIQLILYHHCTPLERHAAKAHCPLQL